MQKAKINCIVFLSGILMIGCNVHASSISSANGITIATSKYEKLASFFGIEYSQEEKYNARRKIVELKKQKKEILDEYHAVECDGGALVFLTQDSSDFQGKKHYIHVVIEQINREIEKLQLVTGELWSIRKKVLVGLSFVSGATLVGLTNIFLLRYARVYLLVKQDKDTVAQQSNDRKLHRNTHEVGTSITKEQQKEINKRAAERIKKETEQQLLKQKELEKRITQEVERRAQEIIKKQQEQKLKDSKKIVAHATGVINDLENQITALENQLSDSYDNDMDRETLNNRLHSLKGQLKEHYTDLKKYMANVETNYNDIVSEHRRLYNAQMEQDRKDRQKETIETCEKILAAIGSVMKVCSSIAWKVGTQAKNLTTVALKNYARYLSTNSSLSEDDELILRAAMLS